MGKAQKKTGKGRLDKYYKLAKEQGYRARSAFKLIQLNKKFAFLDSARCCIDLCAAPGGWLQVASKFMPSNSVIVGVDLVPIKPIPRVATFTADITTPQCRNLIRSEIRDWKADVVLHDGAPNVGTAWIQDAYSQSELVLMSLKLAVEFLTKGGTFVTKVFRSVDYNNLIWVFSQLFGKVEATKPPSSRNVSAEIFVVCRDFLAPKQIDPKFLDPKHVFKDLESSISTQVDKGSSANNFQANVFYPEKKRRHRDGYADGDYTLFKPIAVSQFIKESDPISILGTANKLTFREEEEKEWEGLDITTPDVKANCDDLKVLGKGDFKALLRWRLALREELGLDVKASVIEDATEVVEVAEDMDEDEQIENELERLNAEAAARAKRDRRRANQTKTKTIQRMQLSMTAPLDIGLDQQDQSLHMGQDDYFDLTSTERHLNESFDGEDKTDDEAMQVADSDEEVNGVGNLEENNVDVLEAEINAMYGAYRERLLDRDSKVRVKEARAKRGELEEWAGIRKDSDSEDGQGDEEGGWDRMEAARREETSDSSDESSDEESNLSGRRRKRPVLEGDNGAGPSKRIKLITDFKEPSTRQSASRLWFSQSLFKDANLDVEDETDEDAQDAVEGSISGGSEDPDSEDGDDFSVVSASVSASDDADVAMWDVSIGSAEPSTALAKNQALVTAETVTLAQQLVNRNTTKTRLINDGFNRYSLNSKEGLPSWFLDDESHHYRPNIPVTKEAVAALRARQRALDARPIKKIAEAKARKKMKAAQKLEKAVKKAEGVNATSDLSEREKAQQIEKLMSRGHSSGKKARKDIKVVVAKGANRGIKGRPRGVKGRYTMVDPRMRKELRAKKRAEKATKKRKRS